MKNNRLKIQKILRSIIIEALNHLGLTGWTVQEFAASQYVSLDSCVLMNLVRTKRLGWQSNAVTEDISTGAKRKDEWLELEHWQIHVIKKRPLGADEDTVVTEDVAENLIAWFNGPGMAKFRKNGIAPERIDENTVFVYNDDNEIYQKRCVFTVKIQVPKELITGEILLDSIMPEVRPV